MFLHVFYQKNMEKKYIVNRLVYLLKFLLGWHCVKVLHVLFQLQCVTKEHIKKIDKFQTSFVHCCFLFVPSCVEENANPNCFLWFKIVWKSLSNLYYQQFRWMFDIKILNYYEQQTTISFVSKLWNLEETNDEDLQDDKEENTITIATKRPLWTNYPSKCHEGWMING